MSTHDKSDMLGGWMTTALAISGIIGVGIYMLPRSLAPLGEAAPYAWLISTVGIIALAFAASRLVTPEGGGMQSYVGSQLGRRAGFLVTWSSWVSFCVSCAAIAVAVVSFMSEIVPALNRPGVIPAAAIAVLAVLTLINALGVRKAGGLAIVTVVIRVLPLLAIAGVAWLMPGGSRPSVNAGHAPVSLANLSVACSLTFFALMGFETVLTPVGKIRDPQRTIPRAIIFATAFTAALYFLATRSLAVVLTPQEIEQAASPFADAIGVHWGSTASALATLAIAVSAFGCLNGGVLGIGEMLYSMSLRHEVPESFARVSARNVPINALVAGSSFAALLILLNSSKATVALFTFLTTLASDGILVLYAVAAVAALKVSRQPLTRIAVAVGLAFAAFAFYGSGLEATLMVIVLGALGFAMRALVRRRQTSRPAGETAAEPRGSAA
jgi:APA family basic amino acid/polyamine antiporter